MKDFAIEIYNRHKAEDFICTFPHMTLEQTQKKYSNCSFLVQKKIVSTVCGNRKSDELLAAVFAMATKLPLDVSKNIALQLFHGNQAAVEKFMHMPIGKALEWHAFVERASCGRMIILSPFQCKFFNLFEKREKDEHQDALTKNLTDHEARFFCMGGCVRVVLDEESKKGVSAAWYQDIGEVSSKIVSSEQFALYAEDVKGQLFQLTKQDILLRLKKDHKYTRKELEQLIAIDQKIPFLSNSNQNFSYKYRPAYSLANLYDFFVKDGAIMPIGVLAIPLVCVCLSKIIEAGLPLSNSKVLCQSHKS